MDFEPSPRAVDLAERVRLFVDTKVTPVEEEYHQRIAESPRWGR